MILENPRPCIANFDLMCKPLKSGDTNSKEFGIEMISCVYLVDRINAQLEPLRRIVLGDRIWQLNRGDYEGLNYWWSWFLGFPPI